MPEGPLRRRISTLAMSMRRNAHFYACDVCTLVYAHVYAHVYTHVYTHAHTHVMDIQRCGPWHKQPAHAINISAPFFSWRMPTANAEAPRRSGGTYNIFVIIIILL